VEGGIFAARKKRSDLWAARIISSGLIAARFFPPGWEARLHVRQDA